MYDSHSLTLQKFATLGAIIVNQHHKLRWWLRFAPGFTLENRTGNSHVCGQIYDTPYDTLKRDRCGDGGRLDYCCCRSDTYIMLTELYRENVNALCRLDKRQHASLNVVPSFAYRAAAALFATNSLGCKNRVQPRALIWLYYILVRKSGCKVWILARRKVAQCTCFSVCKFMQYTLCNHTHPLDTWNAFGVFPSAA